jgi:penicillin G amidase
MVSLSRRAKRWLFIPLCTLLVLVLVAAGLGYWTVQRAFPDVDGELELAALDAEVTVHRDAHGVAQLYADSAEDLFRAQGFVHAQDRFWQMHSNRMTTAGRLSEMFGEEQVATDAYLRTMGWRHVAEQEYALLEPDTRAYLDAYAEGVNAYLERRSGAELGLEFAVLGVISPDHEVEEWTPVDSLAWLKAMAWDLRGNMQEEIERASLLASGMERDRIEDLYPAYPEQDHPPIVHGGEVEDGAGDEADEAAVPAEGLEVLGEAAAGLEGVPPMLGPYSSELGSNSWVVSGEHTASGGPLLANDPHLGPQLPSIWHQMGLHCTEVSADCPFELTGFGFPGLPGIVIGRNSDISWGFTNLGPDVADLYLERIDGEAAIVDGEREPLTTRGETIEVAGGDPVEITVRATRHGPLLSDAESASDLREIGSQAPVDAEGEPAEQAREADYGVALSWTALEPGTTADSIFALGTAADFDEFREAARLFEVPAQNLVYADTSGTIGYPAPGRIPVRGAGDGRWPAPGWDSDYDWQGYIDFEELPTLRDPDSGVIVTANQAVIGADYPHHLTEDWNLGYRALRIHELLDEAVAEGGLRAEDMVELQMDAANLGAREIVPHLLQAEVQGTTAEARDLLQDWDFQQAADSAAAAYYNAVVPELLDAALPEVGAEHFGAGGRGWMVLSGLLDDPESAWWQDAEPAGREAALTAAMDAAAENLSERLGAEPAEWRWGDLHTLTLTHPTLGTSGIGPVEWLFNGATVEASGGSDTVNATGWDPGSGFEVTWVPSMRMAVDLGDPDAARWIDLTGPSGHAFHPHRLDQTERWARGDTVPMPFTRESVTGAAEDTLILTPEG